MKDEEIKEFKLLNCHQDTTANELIAATEKARDMGDERDAYISELNQAKLSHMTIVEELREKVRTLSEELENMKENERHFQ